jgi:LPXTG-motif cell wall-anchored protein
MNKKILIPIFAVIILSAITLAAIPKAAKVNVNLISQEPDPANPGDVVDLRFKIENLGSSPTENLIVEIMPQYPFSLYRGSTQKSVSALQGYQTDEKGVIVLYEVRVDEGAAEGEETIDIRYKEDRVGAPWTYIKDFSVRIRTRDLVISVESITSLPDPIPPGNEAAIALKLKNNADSLVRDLKVKLDVADSSVPFAPVRSTTEKSLYQLEAGRETTFGFSLIAEPDAEGGVYKIPISISYTDETGTSYTKNDVISMKIASKPDILATVDSTNIYSKNKAGEVVIKLVNRGLTNIKLLTAKLDSRKDFEVLSQREVYIGNIDSDDYETVEFTLDIKSREDVIKLPIKLTYMDVTNKEFEQTEDVSLRIFSKSDAEKVGMVEKKSIGLTIVILIVAVGLGGYFWWKRKKKKELQKKQGS